MRRIVFLALAFTACGSSSTSTPDAGVPFALLPSPGEVSLAAGGSATVTVALEPPVGVPVTITAELPDGVTADPLTIPANAPSGVLTLHATASVAPSITVGAIDGMAGAQAPTARLVLALAAPHGVLDPAFAGGRYVQLPVASIYTINREAFDDAGNVYLVGSSTDTGLTQAQLVRLTSAGVLDGTFGAGGYARVGGTAATYADRAYVDATGVFAGGNTQSGATNELALWKMTAGGQLDPSFGSGGEVDVPAVGYGWPIALGVANGALRFAATTNDPIAVKPSIGAIDLSTGAVTTTTYPTEWHAQNAVLDGQGGAYLTGGNGVLHLTATGADPAFGTNGVLDEGAFFTELTQTADGLELMKVDGNFTALAAGTFTDAPPITVPSGYYVMAGTADDAGGFVIAIENGTYTKIGRVVATGLDTTFGIAGWVDYDILLAQNQNQAVSLGTDRQGRVVVVTGNHMGWHVMRLLP